MYASSVAEWRYGVRCAPCGVWAVRACGARAREREREESNGAERHGGARAAARDSIADGTALRCGRGGSRHFRRHRGFIPQGLFVYVATRHRLPTHPRCLPSICPSKKENFAEQRHRGHYPRHTSSNAVWLKVLGYAPLSPKIENVLGTPQL